MHQTWFVTWRTYGTWLPGQAGFVGYYRGPEGERRIDNQYGTSPSEPSPPLERYARGLLKSDPVRLTSAEALPVRDQLLETCRHRNWSPHAVAVLAEHVHIVLTTPETVSGTDALRDLKSYCSRGLNRGSHRRWWAERGSTRLVIGEEAMAEVTEYVLERQEQPLVVWPADLPAQEPPVPAGRVGWLTRPADAGGS